MDRKEKSCGAIAFTRNSNQIMYILVKDKKGFWGFPKGHVEKNETEVQTAKREVYEETGLDVEFLNGFRIGGKACILVMLWA